MDRLIFCVVAFCIVLVVDSGSLVGQAPANRNGSVGRSRNPSSASTRPPSAPKPEAAEAKKFPRLIADFEEQRALVISVSDWQPHHSAVFTQIIEKTHGHVDVLVLFNDRAQLDLCLEWLRPLAGKRDHVYFHEMQLDTIWLRDFCPLLAETENGVAAFDFYYEGSRPKDDRMPDEWARRTGAQLKKVEWTLQGGNLLTNGAHLAVATDRIFKDNYIQFLNPLPSTNPEVDRRRMVVDAITQPCNIRQLLILESLQNEATRHADMFMAFLDKQTVVVSRLDPRRDPVNARILDRNASNLGKVKVDGKPLAVHRIDIPVRKGQSWSAFTNLIIANDLVLMPVYKTDPPQMIQQAVKKYQSLLPKHSIETIDITTFRNLQGELHCLSMNLPKVAKLPGKLFRIKEPETEGSNEGGSK